MNENKSPILNVSSSPHFRSPLTTFGVMGNVMIGMVPMTVFAAWHFGLYSMLVVALSIAAACGTEFIFNLITKRPNSLKDGSAIVTGWLLALCLPPSSPVYLPILGSIFAILVAKCFFGGLGQNFMNPALAGRAFLLISFGKAMPDYSYDTVTGATPLAALGNGDYYSLSDMFFGFAKGHIGVSVICVLIGGIWLIASDTISWEIPVASIVSFLIFILALGGRGFDIQYLAAHLVGGGFLLGAFFMATDPVTSPMTWTGQLLFGVVYGFLSAVFRVKGSMADSTTFAIILANLFTPLIDRIPVPQPFGIGKPGASVIPSLEELSAPKKKSIIPAAAIVLTVITLVAGGALAGVNMMTATQIAENEKQAKLAAYAEVLPAATKFDFDESLNAKVAEFAETGYGDGAFGRVYIREVAVGTDDSGNIVGYAISVTSMEGYDGEITMSVGFLADGTVTGLAFTKISETAGMGMKAVEPAFRDQFKDKNVESFKLNKAGGSTTDEEIDSISGASVTSGAVVNSVNAALDFFRNQVTAAE